MNKMLFKQTNKKKTKKKTGNKCVLEVKYFMFDANGYYALFRRMVGLNG